MCTSSFDITNTASFRHAIMTTWSGKVWQVWEQLTARATCNLCCAVLCWHSSAVWTWLPPDPQTHGKQRNCAPLCTLDHREIRVVIILYINVSIIITATLNPSNGFSRVKYRMHALNLTFKSKLFHFVSDLLLAVFVVIDQIDTNNHQAHPRAKTSANYVQTRLALLSRG